MREQLKQLKNDVIDMSKMSKQFAKKRNFFNLKVEEAKEERPVVELFEEDLSDSYSRACCFYNWAPTFIELVEEIKEKYPKYTEVSIRNLVKKEFLGNNSTLEDVEGIERLLDLYFLYDSCGFLKVRDIENQRNEKILNISDNAKGRVIEAKDRTVDAFKNYDLVWEETKLNVSDVLTKTRRKIGHFLLDMDDNE